MFELYLITRAGTRAEILGECEALLSDMPHGRVALQLRAKHLEQDDRRDLAHALRSRTLERGIQLLINADLALAREVGADGVQLPEAGPSVDAARAALGDTALIGASRHDLEGVQRAAHERASFVTLSPVFSVPDKGRALGLAGFGAIARRSAIAVLALGGITAERTASVVAEGAHGIAVIRGVFEQPQPARAMRALLAAIDAGKQARLA